MKSVIIYSRVATVETTMSLEFQEETLKNYCKEQNFKIIKSYKEVYPGNTFNRPEWLKLQDFIETNENIVQSILVIRYDRFCRNIFLSVKEVDRLNKLGVFVECIEQQIENISTDRLFFKNILITPEIEN
jgi:DNA invertase Pin-like site-specific DNA recombinase